MNTVIVFTAKDKEDIFNQGGTGNWKLNNERVRKCDYVLMTANSNHRSTKHLKDDHAQAFMIGKISGVSHEAFDDLGNKEDDRWVIQFSHYAELNIPKIWGGFQNPVKYTDLSEYNIEPDQLDWKPFPKDKIKAIGQKSIQPLTIEEAKNGIAKKLGITPENIEIIIRA